MLVNRAWVRIALFVSSALLFSMPAFAQHRGGGGGGHVFSNREGVSRGYQGNRNYGNWNGHDNRNYNGHWNQGWHYYHHDYYPSYYGYYGTAYPGIIYYNYSLGVNGVNIYGDFSDYTPYNDIYEYAAPNHDSYFIDSNGSSGGIYYQ